MLQGSWHEGIKPQKIVFKKSEQESKTEFYAEYKNGGKNKKVQKVRLKKIKLCKSKSRKVHC